MNECCMHSSDNKTDILLAKLTTEVKRLAQDMTARLLMQDGKIAETCVYIKNNLSNYLTEMFATMEHSGEVQTIIADTLLTELELYKHLKFIITPQLFGDVGKGVYDDTAILQHAIDVANKKGRVLYLPCGVYKISKPLVLNGCTIIGETGNIYSGAGVVIECSARSFTAIKQGSTSTADIMFNLKNIIVKNADVAFEIVYAVNSTYERLYAVDCNTGFKLGASGSVGSMFCEFNNLYTDNCLIGVDVTSSQYFNNNRFNNGFLNGTDKAMSLTVVGGYGAVDNVFNNVEFRSTSGRGIELTNAVNTIFNNCYFECGGNALRTLSYCTVTLNNCVYAMFRVDNKNDDVNVIYSVSGSAFTFDGGTIFLTSDYANIKFFNSGNDGTFQNVVVTKGIIRNGTANGFVFFDKRVKETAYVPEEQTLVTGTVTVTGGTTMNVPFTYATPFSAVPNVVLYTLRGTNGRGLDTIMSERTKDGGVITIHNTNTFDISVSFSVYAKIL